MADPSDLTAVRPRKLPPGEFRVVLAGLMTVMGLAVMDSNIVNTSLPRITSDLGGLSRLSWVVSAFLLTSTVAAPVYGKLSDMYGRRRLMLISIGIFLAGSALCGLSRSMLQLIVFRAIQGLGAGGLIILVQTIIGDLVAPRDRGRYQGLFISVFAIASLAGPLVGGALTTYFSWHWVFYVNLPIGALALLLIMSGLPATAITHRHVIDYGGAALLIVATTCLLSLCSLGFSAERAPAEVALAVLAASGFYAFRWQERRAHEPILNLNLFGNHIFVVGAGITATMAFALFAEVVLLPLYLQVVLGESPVQAALVITPQMIGMIISSSLGGRAVSRTGRIRPFLMASVIILAFALWCLVIATALAFPVWPFTIIAFALGLGMGIGMPNATTIVQNAVPREEMGAATGSLGFVRSLGGTVGVALSGGVINFVLQRRQAGGHLAASLPDFATRGAGAATNLTSAQHAGFTDGYRAAIELGFVMCAILMSSSALFVWSLPEERPRVDEAAAHAP